MSAPRPDHEAQGRPVTVYSTIGSEEEAKELARRLVEARLAACVNLLPMQSVYRWEGALQEGPEVGLIIKTERERLPELMQRLAEWHPYDVPCVEAYEVEEAAGPFAAWVRAETR